jgi:methylated-DNA-[protein]-cysteine S-methyltransferase
MAIVWSDKGVVATKLIRHSESSDAANAGDPCGQSIIERELERDYPTAMASSPPSKIKRIIATLQSHARGEQADLSAIPLDFSAIAPFHRAIYEFARKIPRGTILAYGEVAAAAGSPGAARAVGQAMRNNPYAQIVPCHRVVAANQKIGGYGGPDGVALKERLLADEGIDLRRPRSRAKKVEKRMDSKCGDMNIQAAKTHLLNVDQRWATIFSEIGEFTLELEPFTDPFAALTKAITHQQLATRAAETIHGRFAALFPRCRPKAALLLQLSDETLRSAGLSRAKTLAIRDLAMRTSRGEIPSAKALARMDNDEIIEKLTAVRGIGRWTVEMMLMFRLGRPDVLAVDDYGLRKGYQVAFRKREMPTAKELGQLTQKWSPHRSIASWYLWRMAEKGNGK